MRYRFLAAVAVAFLSSGVASAQPKDAPTVELRLRSVNDLVERFEYVAGLVGQENAAEQVREIVKVLTADGKGVEGIDPKKPLGAYATLAKDIEASPFVVMVPIEDEEQFVKALKDRLGATVEKNDDGTLKAAVPIINELHLRFANGYLYVALRAKDLDPKSLIAPKTFFANDDGATASLVVHIDRIPNELKTFALGQLDLALAEERKKNADKPNAEKQLANLVFDSILSGAKGLADDGKQLTARLFIDPKTDDISAEVTLTAKSGSPTAKYIAGLGKQTSLPVGIVGAATNPVARGSVKVAVPESAKKEYAAAVDALLADVLKGAKPEEEAVVKQLMDAIAPTLKAGELDAAGALTGPDVKGHYRAIGAIAVKEGKGVEKLLKNLVEQFGQFIEPVVEFKFDAEKVGDFAIHRIDLKDVDEKFEKLFGTKTVWLATSDKYIAFSIEPDGETLKEGLKAKAVPVPVLSGEVAVAKLLPAIQPDLKPDELKALIKNAFGGEPKKGQDALTFSVEGGDTLTAKFKVKGKSLRLFAGLNLLKGK